MEQLEKHPPQSVHAAPEHPLDCTEPSSFTVFVVDDDAAVRKSLARVLHSAGFAVTTCASAQEYLDAYDPTVAGCLVLDLAMPGCTGLELQDMLAAQGDSPPIVFLTGHAGIPDCARAMKHGAVEFLTKPVDDNTLIEAILGAVEKDGADRAKRDALADTRKRVASLTARELEVLTYVVAGRMNKVIAAELGIVEKTIKVHRGRMMQKMHARSLAELVKLAAQAGIDSTAAP